MQAQGTCPNCNTENFTYFGDILTVSGSRTETTTPCKECKSQLKFKADERMVSTTLKSIRVVCWVHRLVVLSPCESCWTCVPPANGTLRMFTFMLCLQLVVVPKSDNDDKKGKKAQKKDPEPAAA
jgi:hypothetical protein